VLEHCHDNQSERHEKRGRLSSDSDEAASDAGTDRPAIRGVQPDVTDKDHFKQ
jgi:hypothetical protein